MAAGRSRAFHQAPRSEPGPELEQAEPTPDGPRPTWETVEALLARLAETRALLPTSSSTSSWISIYEPGRRLMLETGSRARWVRVADLQSCWRTFERLGRIRRDDVMEPGRASSFVMALFAQLGGVRRVERDEPYLLLSKNANGQRRGNPAAR
jgi:hypothetical protein